MKGRVDSITKSKSGKAWRVNISGTFYGANFDSRITDALGKVIDFDYDDGKFGLWLKTWGPVTMVPTQAVPLVPGNITSAQQQAAIPIPQFTVPNKVNGDRFYMPFVSNTVAHAILAGLIKTPADLNQWAKAAHDTAIALDAL